MTKNEIRLKERIEKNQKIYDEMPYDHKLAIFNQIRELTGNIVDIQSGLIIKGAK